MKTPIKWLTLGILLMLGVAAVTVGPIASSVLSINGTATNVTITGPNVTNSAQLGINQAGNWQPNLTGWGITNGQYGMVWTMFSLDVTPTASAQAAVDVFWTNINNGVISVTSNRFTTGVGTVAQTFNVLGWLAVGDSAQINTNRLNGATVAFAIKNNTAIPFP